MQGIYWLLTIPYENNETPTWTTTLPEKIRYIKGQQEIGENTGYHHWQLMLIAQRSIRLGAIKKIFGSNIHAELSRSDAASDYVWKEQTRVANTQFELGRLPVHRERVKDWDLILEAAKKSDFEAIPADVFIRCYSSIQKISTASLTPSPQERTCFVFWGPTGTGKSRRAWNEASFDAYPKDPNTKFWDGYRGHEHVVLDEFRGLISISHLLRWLDRYPVLVEIKGSMVALKATTFWITSNLHPRDWYKDLDHATYLAMERRLIIEEIN